MNSSAFRITLTALFIALVFLLGLTPLGGMIPLGFINVTVLCTPVVIGTILLGLKTGLLLGFAFGTCSLLSALGLSMSAPSGLVAPLVAGNIYLAVLLCYVPRLFVPVAAYYTYRGLARGEKESLKSVPLAAAVGSVTNTVLYLGLMLCFYKILGIDEGKLLSLIGGIALVAGGAEAVVAAILATPIIKALWMQSGKIDKNRGD